MTVTIRLGATADKGRLRWQEPARALSALARLDGQVLDVTIQRRTAPRSLSQNAYWWAVPVPLLAEHLGYDQHEHQALHYALLALCFGEVFDERLKRNMPRVRSSRGLTTEQFGVLIDWTIRWAATEWGVVIPEPQEAVYAD